MILNKIAVVVMVNFFNYRHNMMWHCVVKNTTVLNMAKWYVVKNTTYHFWRVELPNKIFKRKNYITK